MNIKKILEKVRVVTKKYIIPNIRSASVKIIR